MARYPIIKGKDWPKPKVPPPPPDYGELLTKCLECGLVYAPTTVADVIKGVCPACWGNHVAGALADARDELDGLYGAVNELREQVAELELGEVEP